MATPGPETVRYGGNTSCVELRLEDGTLIVLDAGTGIRPLGVDMANRSEDVKEINIFLTHLHLDHLMGLGFFGPLWLPDVEIKFWGPPSPLKSLERRIARYLSPPLFPVHLSDVPSNMTFNDVPEDDWRIGSARIVAQPISHSGPTVGYRIEDGGGSLAYMPDHEPGLGIDLRRVEPEWISGHDIARGADVMMHDSQYDEIEYPQRVGWGHSSIEHVVSFARISDVGKLIMFHHDPLHSDEDLENLLGQAHDLWNDAEEPVLAYEGMEIDLSGGAPLISAGQASSEPA
jgi:ribonuclease BN (tRNA processing enzyme)